MNFLTAEWRHLLLLTWEVDPDLIRARVPRGFEPDTRKGKAFVSLVGFDFLKTRVLGIAWPGHTNFPEVNLRYYVRRGEERGVMFVKEIVPQLATSLVARALYNEPYAAHRMRRVRRNRRGIVTYTHLLRSAGSWQSFSVSARDKPTMPADDSIEHFLKEHEWGYGVDHFGRTLRYRVVHPHWRVYPVLEHRLDLDFGQLYGAEWAFLGDREPISRVMAEGSAVEVHFPTVLQGAS